MDHEGRITYGNETPMRLPTLTLGIDLDGRSDQSAFIKFRTHLWPGDRIVITYRRNREKAVADQEN